MRTHDQTRVNARLQAVDRASRASAARIAALGTIARDEQRDHGEDASANTYREASQESITSRSAW
jgi:hypothetical protein